MPVSDLSRAGVSLPETSGESVSCYPLILFSKLYLYNDVGERKARLPVISQRNGSLFRAGTILESYLYEERVKW